MTAEAKHDNFETADDLKTTVPNMKSDEWKMPAPVFRKTSGRLPDSFARKPTPSAEPESSPAAETVDTDIGPGPKSPVLKIVIVALALAAMIAFIAVFLTVVYFLFLR